VARRTEKLQINITSSYLISSKSSRLLIIDDQIVKEFIGVSEYLNRFNFHDIRRHLNAAQNYSAKRHSI